jgi:phage gp36-like protein
MAFATRQTIELIFGAANLVRWADKDNDGDAGKIAAAIAWALDEATLQLTSRLSGGPYATPFATTPPELVTPCARLAGVLLYDGRGITDADAEGNPTNQLAPHRKMVDQFIKSIKSGNASLSGLTSFSTVPSVGEFTDTRRDCPPYC